VLLLGLPLQMMLLLHQLYRKRPAAAASTPAQVRNGQLLTGLLSLLQLLGAAARVLRDLAAKLASQQSHSSRSRSKESQERPDVALALSGRLRWSALQQGLPSGDSQHASVTAAAQTAA
jgi:hypothetical protein